MKKTTFTIALLVAISVLLMSFVKIAKDDKTVKLSDISASLSLFEGIEGQDFVGNTITYKVIEKDSYDKLFKESALVYATVVQVNGTIDGINKGTITTDSDFAKANIGFALKDVPELKDRITKLQEQLQNLKPKEDFKGLEMKKAPKAAEGIDLAKKQLAESSSMLPQISENIKTVAEKVIQK